MRRFENKVAIVTGGANGIGLAIVKRLVKEGAKVVIADIDTKALKAVCDELKYDVLGLETDVSIKEQVSIMVDAAIEKYGKIHILFNNAGQLSYYDFLELSAKEFERIIAVNLLGVFLCGQAVARKMVKLGIQGCIVNTASIASDVVTPVTAHYAASKGGVAQLTKAMAVDLAPHKIRVNAVGPGTTITNMTERTRSNPEKYEAFLNKTLWKRFGQPEEVAAVAAFLASDDASYVNGCIYYVDGGWRTL